MYQTLTAYTELRSGMEAEQTAAIDLVTQRMYDIYQSKKLFQGEIDDKQDKLIGFKVDFDEFVTLSKVFVGHNPEELEDGLQLFIENRYAIMNADGGEIYLSPKGLLLMNDIWTRSLRKIDGIS